VSTATPISKTPIARCGSQCFFPFRRAPVSWGTSASVAPPTASSARCAFIGTTFFMLIS
jgi:hypothetical protein